MRAYIEIGIQFERKVGFFQQSKSTLIHQSGHLLVISEQNIEIMKNRQRSPMAVNINIVVEYITLF